MRVITLFKMFIIGTICNSVNTYVGRIYEKLYLRKKRKFTDMENSYMVTGLC